MSIKGAQRWPLEKWLQKLHKNVGDLDKLIVAKALKTCQKSNKSPNLVTLRAKQKYNECKGYGDATWSQSYIEILALIFAIGQTFIIVNGQIFTFFIFIFLF